MRVDDGRETSGIMNAGPPSAVTAGASICVPAASSASTVSTATGSAGIGAAPTSTPTIANPDVMVANNPAGVSSTANGFNRNAGAVAVARAAAAAAAEKDGKGAEMVLECDEDADSDDEDGAGGGSQMGGAGGAVASGGGDSFVSNPGSAAGSTFGGIPSSFFRRKPVKTRWSAIEDARLKRSVEAHGNSNWKRVRFLSSSARRSTMRCNILSPVITLFMYRRARCAVGGTGGVES